MKPEFREIKKLPVKKPKPEPKEEPVVIPKTGMKSYDEGIKRIQQAWEDLNKKA